MSVEQQSISGEDLPEVDASGKPPEKEVEKTIVEVQPGRKLNQEPKEVESDEDNQPAAGSDAAEPDAADPKDAKKSKKSARGFKSAIKATGTQFAALMGMKEDSLFPKTSTDDEYLGRILNSKYGIKKLVKKDEFAIIYSGRDINEGRKVIVKTPFFNTEEIVSAFKNYAEKNLKLRQKNIVESIEYFELDNGRPFFVTNFCIGITLEDLIKEVGKIDSPKEYMSIFKDIFNAVNYAHLNKVIHGHIKPSKIYLEEDGSEVIVKLSDFAIADYKRAVLDHVKKHYELQEFPYLSPEHVRNEEITQSSDIYNLGLTSYYVLSGVDAFRKESKEEYVRAHTTESEKPEPLAQLVPRLHCAEEMDRIISEALDPDQDWRIQNIDELLAELNTWFNSPSKNESLPEGEIKDEDEGEDKHPSEPPLTEEEAKNLKNTMRSLVALKKNQVAQEGTVIMKFTDIAGKKGVRESPLKTASRLIFTYIGGGLLLVLVTTYSIVHWNEIKNFYFTLSKDLALIGKHQVVSNEEPDGELPPVEGGPLTEEEAGNKKASTTGTGTGTTSATGTRPGQMSSRKKLHISRRRKFKYSESPSYRQFIPHVEGSKKEIIDPSKKDRFIEDKKYFKDGKIW